ncbi:hypothetical protein FRC01_000069 [Tulasnella sp. 417]|nr:hypothetical protein FRC01_000069 [Tulasnella sp. 417]
MAVYSPAPSYPLPLAQFDSPSYESPSGSSSSPSPPTSRSSPPARQISRSERMLMATLRRADEHEKAAAGDADPDYFSRAMDSAWSRSQSVNASPTRHYRKLPSHHSYLSPPLMEGSRPPSPVAARRLETDGAVTRRGRTPSPSPHPYAYRSASPRNGHPAHPSLSRTQTAPARSQMHSSSRPSTPSQLPRRSTSPAYGYTNHSRRESSGGTSAAPAVSSPTAPSTSYQKRTAHEEMLRTRLESVLARQQQQDAAMTDASSTATRSRGPSFSRTAPATVPGQTPVGSSSTTVTGDQWTWSQTANVPAMYLSVAPAQVPSSPKASTRRSPSISRTTGPQRTTSSSHISGMVSPSRIKESIMITPPPSPPHNSMHADSVSSAASSTSASRAPSQARQTLGIGHPDGSRSPSQAPSMSSCRVTPPPFDARSASLALKEQHGYVSFSDIEGLGEPDGMDAPASDDEGECTDERGRSGKWWEVWRK